MKLSIALSIVLLAAGCATQKPTAFLPIQPAPPPVPVPVATPPALRLKGFNGPRVSAQVVTNPITLLVSRSIAPPPAVRLAWDALADPAVVGYNVYQGVGAGQYTNVFNAGTNLTCTFSNLAFSTTYHFAATSYTAGGLESDYSTEAIDITPTAPLPPGNFRLQAAWASNIGGPWLQDTNWPAIAVANPLGNMLWRLDALRILP